MKYTPWLLLLFSWVLFQPAFSQQFSYGNASVPKDDIVTREIVDQRLPLPYPTVHERDILWERKIWREIDVREKMNLPFVSPQQNFFKMLIEEIAAGNIQAYSTEDDQFSYPISSEALQSSLITKDTVTVFDPVTYEETFKVVENSIDPSKIIKYRLKEVWYFDANYSTLKVRILGIAPIIREKSVDGTLTLDQPLFWIHYPDSRKTMANHRVYNPYAENSNLTWDDWFEMRFFSSYIMKENNIHDRRLQDYLSGRDLLLEAEKIRMELFNLEHDMWSY